jgi:hypothetical protein
MMKDLFSLDFNGFAGLLVEFIILLFIFIFLMWIAIIISAMIERKKENPIRAVSNVNYLAVQRALLWFMIIFTLYIVFFVAFEGKHMFIWNKFPFSISNTYYLLLPQLLIYILMILVYVLISNSLRKQLKQV